jgi:hypothetical protein
MTLAPPPGVPSRRRTGTSRTSMLVRRRPLLAGPARTPGLSRIRKAGPNRVRSPRIVLVPRTRASPVRSRGSRARRARVTRGRSGRAGRVPRLVADRVPRRRRRLPRQLANANQGGCRSRRPPAIRWAASPYRSRPATPNRSVHHPRPPATGSAPNRWVAARIIRPSRARRERLRDRVRPPQRPARPAASQPALAVQTAIQDRPRPRGRGRATRGVGRRRLRRTPPSTGRRVHHR